jgi:hypothetical protein
MEIMQLEVEHWERGGSGLSPSPKIRLGLGLFTKKDPKPDFFTYVVKPEPD